MKWKVLLVEENALLQWGSHQSRYRERNVKKQLDSSARDTDADIEHIQRVLLAAEDEWKYFRVGTALITDLSVEILGQKYEKPYFWQNFLQLVVNNADYIPNDLMRI